MTSNVIYSFLFLTLFQKHIVHSLTLTCIIDNFHLLLPHLGPIPSLEMDQSDFRFIFWKTGALSHKYDRDNFWRQGDNSISFIREWQVEAADFLSYILQVERLDHSPAQLMAVDKTNTDQIKCWSTSEPLHMVPIVGVGFHCGCFPEKLFFEYKNSDL